MWMYLLIFIAAALFGFVYGKKAHLKQLGNILLQQGMPLDQVSKLSECVRTYNIISPCESGKKVGNVPFGNFSNSG